MDMSIMLCYVNFLDMSQPRSYNMLQPWPRHRDIFFSSRGTAPDRDTMEPEVLPVFYYNDMLLSNIGDTIGLSATGATALPSFLGLILECERCSYRSTYS